MASSFRRAGSDGPSKRQDPNQEKTLSSISPLGLRGVKPWAGGIHLTSVGLNDLDAILGGGQPLGTCVLVHEDRWTRDLALTLVRYWCTEAISQEQNLVIPVYAEGDYDEGASQSEVVNDILDSLPRNLHWDKEIAKRNRAEQNAAPEQSRHLEILREEEHADADAEDESLDIAWQYKKSVQRERLAQQPATPKEKLTNIFCHSYDLSGRLSDQSSLGMIDSVDPSNFLKPVPLVNISPTSHSGFQWFQNILKLILNNDSITSDKKVLRLLLYHVDVVILTQGLPLLLAHIRQHKLPVVVMICTPPAATMPSKFWIHLQRIVDVVLIVEGFASRREYPPPPEFRHLQGLLTIKKVATVTAATANGGGGHFGDLTTSKRPAAYMYGLKRDRRKLHIPLLHIPPEDYAQGGGSVGSGGVRSGAGRGDTKERKSGGLGCATNMGGSVLDF